MPEKEFSLVREGDESKQQSSRPWRSPESALSTVMMILVLSSLRRRHLTVACLRPESEKAYQHFVLFLRELVHGTVGSFLEHSFSNGLLQGRGDFWIAKGFPHATHRIHEVFHEMFDAASAAAEVPLQTRAHDCP